MTVIAQVITLCFFAQKWNSQRLNEVLWSSSSLSLRNFQLSQKNKAKSIEKTEATHDEGKSEKEAKQKRFHLKQHVKTMRSKSKKAKIKQKPIKLEAEKGETQTNWKCIAKKGGKKQK